MNKLAIVVLALGLVAAPAFADVIDPDAHPAGTDISNLYPGVTLGFGTPVYSATDALASTGTRAFSSSGAGPSSWFPGAFRADFAPGVTAVSIDMINNDFDAGQMDVYGAGDVLLGSVQLLVNGPTTFSFFSGADIAYIYAGGHPSGPQGHADDIHLDNLRTNGDAIPEPATLALLLASAAFFAARRRRRS